MSTTKEEKAVKLFPTLDEDWKEQLKQMNEIAKDNIWYLINAFTGREDSPLSLKELIAFSMNVYNVGYNEGLKGFEEEKGNSPLCTKDELEWLDKELNS